jgi:hypothetical protein
MTPSSVAFEEFSRREPQAHIDLVAGIAQLLESRRSYFFGN